MSDERSPEVDMSSEAVFRRLKEASDLLELCLMLGKARRVLPDREPAAIPPSGDDSPSTR